MKLVSFLSPDGDARAGVCIGDSVCDISALAAAVGVDLPADMTDLLIVDEGLEITKNIVSRVSDFPSLSFEQVTLLAAVPFPGKILALAGNFQAHIQEGGGAAVDKSGITPRVFMKPGTSIIGTNEPILLPKWSETVDYELELSIVIGEEAKYVDAEDAADYIAGYVVSNDVSARTLTIADGRDERPMDDFFDWLNGKWFDSFGAIGPYLVTADEVGDPHNLKMSLSVNGEQRQDGNTGQMIFNCYEIVSFCSHLTTLEPGDLIMTGTPSGVGATTDTYLQPGDEIEAEIEKLGVLKKRGRSRMIPSSDLCVIKLRSGERISEALADLLDPIDMLSMHEYVLPAESDVELHYHDFDEYWLFNEGNPKVTLNLPDGTTRVYHLEPGDLVATLRGVAHTLYADHTLRYFQWHSVIKPDARTGHLVRQG